MRNHRDKMVKIPQGFSPKSRNCVYAIYCVKCNVTYLGETKNTLSTQMMQHRYNIKNQKEVDTLLVQHFLKHVLASVRMAGLQRAINWSDWERKKRERHWIFYWGTIWFKFEE